MSEELHYQPNPDEIAAGYAVAKIRNRKNRGQTNMPGGVETMTEEELLEQHLRACLSEIAVSRVFNLAWTGCGKGALGAKDVGGFLQVRSIIDKGRRLLVKKDADKDDPEDPYVLVYVNALTYACTLLGWEWGYKVLEARDFELEGAWCLSQEYLQDLFALQDLVIERWKRSQPLCPR